MRAAEDVGPYIRITEIFKGPCVDAGQSPCALHKEKMVWAVEDVGPYARIE